ncbi:MAG: hypothetical protein J0M00_12910, partial [Burkholderiales bacterium]|nr:hypothetical protein [Burkholderiales bacterium]
MNNAANFRILTRGPAEDLLARAAAIRSGQSSAAASMAQALAAADGAACRHAYVRRFDAMARAAADAVDRSRAA